jgi:soluble lytic murein transglycosylase
MRTADVSRASELTTLTIAKGPAAIIAAAAAVLGASTFMLAVDALDGRSSQPQARLVGAVEPATVRRGLVASVPPSGSYSTEITGSIPDDPLSQPDPAVSATFREALQLVASGEPTAGFELARGFENRAERLAAQWSAIYFGGGDVPYASVVAFMEDAPEFSTAPVFRTRVEQALLRTDPDADAIIAGLGGSMPNTIPARIALAEAYVADGQRERAAGIARSIWVENFLDTSLEKRVLARLGPLLTPADHWDRAVHLMMHDRAKGVERLMEHLTPAQQSLAVARNAVSRNAKDAKSLLDSVDPSMTAHPVYLFSRAQRARQFELWDDAVAWLDKAKGPVPDAAEFWYQRRDLMRRFVAAGEVKRAYAATAGYVEGTPASVAQAQFHAGWIALAFLKDPALARSHFERMAAVAPTVDTISQANFWLGRTLDQLDAPDAAAAAYTIAAGHQTVYYGQLARDALKQPSVEIRPMPDWQASEPVFESRDLVKAVRLLAEAGEADKGTILLRTFASGLEDGGELALAARLAQSLGAHHLAISIADAADKRGVPLDLFNFPQDGLPTTRLASIDPAAVFAVARQESRFQIDAISSAGARGLMQLMPGTARETAAKVGLQYSKSRLTSDAEYNALLGSTYLKAQLEAFDGSLVLAAAAYNAGPGNARKWVRTFGDPRSSAIDPIVWVELIPFEETRTYVRRVLGNYMVYRARSGRDDLSTTEALRRIPG